MTEWTIVAKLHRAKNKQGGLFVVGTKGLPFLLSCGMEVCFVPPVLRVPRRARVIEIKQIGAKNLVFFEGITDQTMAEQLIDHYCLVRIEDLPDGWDECDELDLVGFDLVSSDGIEFGIIDEVQPNPAHPLLVIRRNNDNDSQEDKKKDSALVPLVEDFIVEIDEEKKRITMELPQGLFEV